MNTASNLKMKVSAKRRPVIIITALLLPFLSGCTKTISRADLAIIDQQYHDQNQHASWYVNRWTYIGSDDDYDYVIHHSSAGKRKTYRVRQASDIRFGRHPKSDETWPSLTVHPALFFPSPHEEPQQEAITHTHCPLHGNELRTVKSYDPYPNMMVNWELSVIVHDDQTKHLPFAIPRYHTETPVFDGQDYKERQFCNQCILEQQAMSEYIRTWSEEQVHEQLNEIFSRLRNTNEK